MAGTRRRNLHFIPMAVCILCPVTFITTFIIALAKHHVTIFKFPYISYTGVDPPESCIFSQLLNIASLLLGMCVYIRHLQVTKFTNFKGLVHLKQRVNKVSTFIGYLSCLGMCIVGNFQVTNVWQVHYLGAMLCFWGGTVYFVFQTIFSYHMGKIYGSKFIFYTRLILCILCLVFNISAVVPGIYSVGGYADQIKCDLSQAKCWLHLLSAASEWLLAITQSGLVLTFLPEFKDISIYAPVLHIEGITDKHKKVDTEDGLSMFEPKAD